MQQDHITSPAPSSGKMVQLVHSLLMQSKEHPGSRIQVETANRLTMERLARVLFFTAGLSPYTLAVKDVSLEERGFILFENGTEIHFSLVVPEEEEFVHE